MHSSHVNLAFLKEIFRDLRYQSHRNVNDNDRLSGRRKSAALFQVALCYFHGWGTDQNKSEFGRYFRLATRAGSRSAYEIAPFVWTALRSTIPSVLPDFKNPEEKQIASRLDHVYNTHVELFPDISHSGLAWRRWKGSAEELSVLLRAGQSSRMDFRARTFAVAGDKNEHARKTSSLFHTRFEPRIVRLPIDALSPPPLHRACLAGDLEAVKDLMHSRVYDPNVLHKASEHTPLTAACSNGHASVAIHLLDNGADPRALDSFSRSPLHYLARFEADALFEVGHRLLARGAPLEELDSDGLSALAFAVDGDRNWVPMNSAATIMFFLENGANVYGGAAASPLLEPASPLVRAVLSQNLTAVVGLLLKILSSLSKPDSIGNWDLFNDVRTELLRELATEPEIRIVQRAIDSHGTDFFFKLVQFIAAIHEGNAEDLLLATGLAPSDMEGEISPAVLRHGFGRLFDIIDCGDGLPGVDIRIEGQYAVTTKTKYKARLFTVFLEAISAGAQSLVLVLAPHLRRIHFYSFLAMAGNRGHFHVLRDLLRLGAKFDASFEGSNIFHAAADGRWPLDQVQMLCRDQGQAYDLRRMANQQMQAQCCTPFDLAVFNGYFELAEYFRALGADVSSAHIRNTLQNNYLSTGTGLTLLGHIIVSDQYPSTSRPTPLKIPAIQYLTSLDATAIVCPVTRSTVFHIVWQAWQWLVKSSKS